MSSRVDDLKPRPRPPSLSLITVTSLESQRKNNPFRQLNERFRTEGLGFVNNNNLDDFYETDSTGTPKIVIDKGSDPELYKKVITEEEMNENNKVDGLSNSSINSNHSPFIQYLTPPSKKSRRGPPSEAGSVSSISTIGSKRHHKSPESVSSLKSSKRSISKEDDTQSIGGCSIGHSHDFSTYNNQYDTKQMDERLIKFMSIIYAFLLIVLGAIICISDLSETIHYRTNSYIILTNVLGFAWLVFIHWDIHKYKVWALEYMKPDPNKKDGNKIDYDYGPYSYDDDISINTAVIFNSVVQKPTPDDSNASAVSQIETAYRFLHGKHSGNFYLKCGITVFCFGSIIHMGIQIFTHVYYFADSDPQCENLIIIFVLFIRIFYSFYQLFIVFKYSNILINRYTTIARFALMHMVGTALSSWFITIIKEAIDDYVHKVQAMNVTENWDGVLFQKAVRHELYCLSTSVMNQSSLNALPYLYPFTIEYNITLASIWYMIWTNIGKDDHNSHLHNLREEVSENDLGEEETVYHSSLAINADCHASNRGLFSGLSTLLIIIITIVVYFTTINDENLNSVGVSIYSAQIGLLTVTCCIVIGLAYKQMRRLDIVSSHHLDNSSTAMDDLLVLVPIPFYFTHYILSIIAVIKESEQHKEIKVNSVFLIIIYFLTIFQVLIQSPFIVDGIRRCSNAKKLRFKKPGRELVTFALILNITLWILNTFELKSVEKYQGLQETYGKMTWMVISHTTLPVMLFYRYHSSVCLSDIWKHAYEKDHIGHQ